MDNITSSKGFPKIKPPKNSSGVPKPAKLAKLPKKKGKTRRVDGYGTTDDEEEFTDEIERIRAASRLDSHSPDDNTGLSPGRISPSQILIENQEDDPKKVFGIDLHGKRLKKIENVEKFVRVKTLDLSCNLIKIIENLNLLEDVKDLKLYGNDIREVRGLGSIKQLTCLSLQHNRISHIGDGLSNQRVLKVLRLDSNELTHINSKDFNNCIALTNLDISNNYLDSLSAVKYAPNIQELIAVNNRLTVADVGSCYQLTELDFSNNRINDLSPLNGLKKLAVLRLAHNCIKTLKHIGTIRQLQEIHISHNRLDDVSTVNTQFPQLQILNVSNNFIDSFKNIRCLQKCKHLVELGVSGNPFIQWIEDISGYQVELSVTMPSLEVLDGVIIRKLTASQQAPLMRTMTTTNMINTKHVENQLKAVDNGMADHKQMINETFCSLRQCLHRLEISSPEAEFRSVSRCNSRSRLEAAKDFAASSVTDSL